MTGRKVKLVMTPEEAIIESKRYFENANATLKKSPIEWDRYKDEKYVKEACAMAYLATLRAIDAYLLSKGIPSAKLPTSIEGYEKELLKVPHNGKIMSYMRIVYDNLHLFGYYRGGIEVEMIKSGFKHAKAIIDTFIKLADGNYKKKCS